MFGFFKRNLSEIDALKYQMLAVSTSATALTVTTSLLAQSSKRDGKTVMRLYAESLIFAVCLAQMTVQKKYKLKDGNDIVTIIQELQQQIRELPAPTEIPENQEMALTRGMLDIANTDEFFEAVSYYAARDYEGMGITDEGVEAFCKATCQIPSIIKGAGWTMALLMFQIRVSGFLLEDADLPQRLLPMLTTAREGCQFMMKQFDHVLG
jgi:hypothetical protein